MGAVWAYVERRLCPCWAIVGLSWVYVGPSRAHVEPSGPSWAYVGPSWAHVELCWAHLGPTFSLCWAHVGLCWAYVGPYWALLGAMLGPCLGHLCWNDLKMQFFPPRAPSWSPKPRKNRCFLTSPRWNPLPPKGPKHRKKNDDFSTPQAKYTVNYSDFSGSGVVWVWTRGGSAAPITFGYYRRPPARTRACGRRPDSEVFFGDATHYINSQGIPKVWRVMVHSPVCLRHLNAP